MKKLNLLICILLTFTFCNAQDFEIIKQVEPEILTISYDSTSVTCGGVELITFQALSKYEKECLADTIIAVPFENEFIIYHESYGEMVSTEQLNKRGYIYAYRWLINVDPYEWEYYFVKEPTIKGFIKWVTIKYKKSLNLSKTEKN